MPRGYLCGRAGGRLCTRTASHMLSTRHQRATGTCVSRALLYANTRLHKHTLRAHADPRLSAAQPNLCQRKSIFPYLYPLPQTCTEEHPNPVSKQRNSDVTSVQFIKPLWNKSGHVRLESGIQDNSTHSQAQKTQLQTLESLHKHQNWHIQLISQRIRFESSAYVPNAARVCVLSQLPHTFSHSHNCTACLQQNTNT